MCIAAQAASTSSQSEMTDPCTREAHSMVTIYVCDGYRSVDSRCFFVDMNRKSVIRDMMSLALCKNMRRDSCSASSFYSVSDVQDPLHVTIGVNNDKSTYVFPSGILSNVVVEAFPPHKRLEDLALDLVALLQKLWNENEMELHQNLRLQDLCANINDHNLKRSVCKFVTFSVDQRLWCKAV